MPPKENRFTKAEFDACFANSDKTSTKFGLLCICENFQNKFGVSVSKKISKKAKDRNQIRRRVYSAVDYKNLKKGTIFIVNKEIVGAKPAEIGKIIAENIS